MDYYFTTDGQNVKGPAKLQQLAAAVQQGKLPIQVLVCEAGGQEWKKISALVPASQLAALPATQTQPQSATRQAAAAASPAPSPSPAAAAPSAAAGYDTASGAATPGAGTASSAQQAASDGATVAEPATASMPSTASSAFASSSTASPISASQQSALVAREPTALAARPDFSAVLVDSRRPVNAKDHISAGTSMHTAIGFLVAGVIALVGLAYIAIFTFGIGILVAAVVYWIGVRRGRVRIHGGAVKVTADQFPEIYRCTHDFAERLGMKKVPEVYIAEDSVMNAVAAKLGKGKYVILIDDLVWGCLMAGETKALSFIIAHELAHHQLGHTGVIRSFISGTYKALSRCDEMTCDAVASALVEDVDSCARGLALLLIGPQLVGQLNWRALDAQAAEVTAKKTWKGAEGSMTHPLLLRRYAALRGLA